MDVIGKKRLTVKQKMKSPPQKKKMSFKNQLESAALVQVSIVEIARVLERRNFVSTASPRIVKIEGSRNAALALRDIATHADAVKTRHFAPAVKLLIAAIEKKKPAMQRFRILSPPLAFVPPPPQLRSQLF